MLSVASGLLFGLDVEFLDPFVTGNSKLHGIGCLNCFSIVRLQDMCVDFLQLAWI